MSETRSLEVLCGNLVAECGEGDAGKVCSVQQLRRIRLSNFQT